MILSLWVQVKLIQSKAAVNYNLFSRFGGCCRRFEVIRNRKLDSFITGSGW